ncbi:MAG: hypothetical protein V7784_09630 [Oceanospirillaceae bacterium]
MLAIIVSGCTHTPQQTNSNSTSIENRIDNDIEIKLSSFNSSKFKQVTATFYTTQSKALVFRVVSDLELAPKWFANLSSIETLAIYDNSRFLLSSVLSSPWPFQDRQLITCVNTQFLAQSTHVTLKTCPHQQPLNKQLLSISDAQSSWVITQINEELVQVRYQAWIDPAGYVPAVLFNTLLNTTTRRSLTKLRILISNAKTEDYAY